MDNKNTISYKSKRFAIRIVHLYQYLTNEKNEYVLSKQILKSGTSIGANIAESECSISKNDFLSKVYIALKESAETLYWLELLNETGFITNIEFKSLYNDCLELKKMMQSTTKTLKSRLEDN